MQGVPPSKEGSRHTRKQRRRGLAAHTQSAAARARCFHTAATGAASGDAPAALGDALRRASGARARDPGCEFTPPPPPPRNTDPPHPRPRPPHHHLRTRCGWRLDVCMPSCCNGSQITSTAERGVTSLVAQPPPAEWISWVHHVHTSPQGLQAVEKGLGKERATRTGKGHKHRKGKQGKSKSKQAS
eukprot:362259-Chlamydomonas_euryale.AAC.4